MGSSNCKSFSPSKAAAKCKENCQTVVKMAEHFEVIKSNLIQSKKIGQQKVAEVPIFGSRK